MLGPAVYILNTLTSLFCAVLLLLGYKRGRSRLLLWSGLCFVGLTLGSALVFIDLVIVPEIDLFVWRLSVTAVAMTLLLFGLIWETR